VHDDGVGGADAWAGTGLSGIADRVAALDGGVLIDSPPDGGTLVRAEIPFAAPVPAQRAADAGNGRRPPRPAQLLSAPPAARVALGVVGSPASAQRAQYSSSSGST
jgi:hypothetical protein